MWLLLVLLPVTVLVLGSRGILTVRVVAHPITFSPFFPGFCYDRRKSSYLRKLESTLYLKKSHVCYIQVDSCV